MEEAKVIDLNQRIKPDPESDPLYSAKNYLDENFDFRINSISQRVTFKRKYEKHYQVLTDFLRNSIYLELKSAGKKIVYDDLKKLLYSDQIPVVNPLKEFIVQQSKLCKDVDFIQQIANTVTVENSTNWQSYFQKWFVAMVANVFDESRCTNQSCLVLAGEQGIFKTTWLEALVPDELSEYKYTGQIKPENKDTLRQLALRLLIVIDDQLHKLNKTNQDDLKFLITLPTVSWRPVFKEFDVDAPRLASFCGSVNGMEYLTDLTGSRRFLSFYVKEIRMEELHKIDIAKAYGQAYKLYKSGFQYWFDLEEIKVINAENEAFTNVSVEEEMIKKYFDLRNPKNEGYNSGEIKIKLEQFTKERLSAKKIGEVMRKLGITHKNLINANGNRALRYPITFNFIDDTNIEDDHAGDKPVNSNCPY
jgi:predicted P-loop ATPase